jgi:hypothetical protein
MKLNNAIVRHMTLSLDEKPKVHVEEEKKRSKTDEENVDISKDEKDSIKEEKKEV